MLVLRVHFQKFPWGVSPKPLQKSLDALRPQKRLAVLGLNFSYFFIGELKTLMIVLKAMTAYVQALNTKYMPNCDIFILSANSSFFMWGFWDFYVRFLRFLCDVRFLRFAFGINPESFQLSGKFRFFSGNIRINILTKMMFS